MRAAVMHSFESPLSIETVDDPVCAADGAVVRVLATGVCRSDWHGWMGHDASIELPHVPGHELCGEIVEVGPEVHGFAVGDRVTVPVLLRLRRVRAVPARRDPGVREGHPAGLHDLGLVRGARRAAAARI